MDKIEVLKLLKIEMDSVGIVCLEDFLNSNGIDVEKFDFTDIEIFISKNQYVYQIMKNLRFKKSYITKFNQELYKIDSISSMVKGLNEVRGVFDFDENIPYINDREELKRNIEYFNNEQIIAKKSMNDKSSILKKSSSHEDVEYRNIYFRGQSKISYSLLPSLFRSENLILKESDMYNEIVSRCPNEFKDSETHLEVLQKMQHYSLPTRLLDISSNVLIALYFACIEDVDYDAEVIVFSPNQKDVKNAYSDTIEILCSLSCINSIDKLNINGLIEDFSNDRINKEEFNQRDSVQKLVHEVRRMTGNFDAKINPKNLNNIYFVKPIRNNGRIIKQDGAFIVVGYLNQTSLDAMQKMIIEEISENVVKSEGKRFRFIIPNSAKKKIIGELNLMGINQSTIYPEIERISQFIKATSLK